MNKICKINGCKGEHVALGLCSKHYARVYKGNPVLNEKEIMILPKNAIPLTMGKYTLLDKKHYEKLSKYSWHLTYQGYAGRNVLENGKRTISLMHREILGLKKGELCDHINRDRLDNRMENLRKCTINDNNRNMGLISTNTSGFKGVSKNGGKWQSYINVNNKKHSLGYWHDPVDAAIAYNIAAQLFFGEFAYINPV